MKDKITLKEFFESKERLAIHCNTEEKANKLLKEFDKFGKTWWTGEGYLENTCFDTYKDKTCYSNSGAYEETEHYKDEKCKIYSFEDIIFEEEAKPKNLIPEIAKMLGVEIGEEFGVSSTAGRFYFNNKWLVENGTNINDNNTRLNAILSLLLNGSSKIEKLLKKPQLTDAERVILKNLPKEYKWIARDKDDELSMFNHKPFKREYTESWGLSSGVSLSLEAFKHLFQFIKWEDEEPYNIEELLKGE